MTVKYLENVCATGVNYITLCVAILYLECYADLLMTMFTESLSFVGWFH